MPRLSVASSAGTTMSRLIRSTIFITAKSTLPEFNYLGSSCRRLDQAITAVIPLVYNRDAAILFAREYEEGLMQQVQLHDRIRDRHRLRVELLGLDDRELRGRVHHGLAGIRDRGRLRMAVAVHLVKRLVNDRV